MNRYDPFEEMDRMFEQLRTRVWTPEGSFRSESGMPAKRESLGEGASMDLKRHGDEYVFVADLPGFEREDIDLTLSDGVLTLAAESEIREERTPVEGDEIAIRGEFAQSRRVSERVTLPEAIVEDEIAATFRNGVLEVHLPLRDPEEIEGDRTEIDISE